MGTFATTTSLQTLMPGTSFDTATTALMSLCITWSENFIRTQLARRYNMSASPFDTSTSIPPHLTSITEKMAMGYYFKNASRGSKESMTRGDALLKEGKDEVMSIAKYETDLVDGAYAVIDSSCEQVYASYSSYHTTFNEDNPLNWRPDYDKLSDIRDGRD